MWLPVINKQLAERIEQPAIDYMTSRISSIGERSGNLEGGEIGKFGAATAFYIKSMPWGQFNWAKGFSQCDLDRLEDIIQFYRDRNRAF